MSSHRELLVRRHGPDGYYLPSHQARQDVYLIAGQLAHGVSPSAAIGDYLGEFNGQEVHLTAEPAGPLGGVVKCWKASGYTFCMCCALLVNDRPSRLTMSERSALPEIRLPPTALS